MSAFGLENRIMVAVAAGLALSLAPVPATAEEPKSDEIRIEAADDDPLEGLNRLTHGFNDMARTMFLNPAAELYQALMPPPIKGAVSNVVGNLTEPLTAVSSMVQGDGDNATAALERFMINSTLGLGGINDEATDMGVVRHQRDLGMAAGAAGADEGAYLVLPLLGPSNMRDLGGDAVNYLVNPLALASTADKAIVYSENKDQVEAMNRAALDPYVAEREAFRQNRRHRVMEARHGPGAALAADAPGDE